MDEQEALDAAVAILKSEGTNVREDASGVGANIQRALHQFGSAMLNADINMTKVVSQEFENGTMSSLAGGAEEANGAFAAAMLKDESGFSAVESGLAKLAKDENSE